MIKKPVALSSIKYMPVGTCFPFDFGFIPHTKGGDGDPLDVIVLSDFPSAVGTVIECRIIGVIMAKQKEKGKRFNHNDRLVAVPVASLRYEEVKTIHGLGDSFLKRIITFFEHYNAMQNREFKLLDIKNSSHAVKLIEQSASEQ